mmetsp:Transcript_17595/g.38088  ORF Transcript_17595/g.38088 Transcript_17595/m.38088 type:complete len:393 (+) Transcript_17595:250-1428(+)
MWRVTGYIPEYESIWNLLQPWVPTITEIVKANRNEEEFRKYFPHDPEREPELNWVFFRKYSPNEERNSLKQHLDKNMNTVNIELSNDYEGGGLFYIKPSASTGLIPEDYYGYEWTNSVKRENTSDTIFPDLHAGDAIFYNFTVHHAVAPVESGARYSMAFFYDQPGEFKVIVHNMLPNFNLDIVLAYDTTQEIEVWDKMFGDLPPNGRAKFSVYEGDLLKALVAGTDTIVADIEIKREPPLYTISQIKNPNEFGVKLVNELPDMELNIMLVFDAAEGNEVWKMVFEKVTPDETVIYHAYEGDMLQALVADTDTVVADIEITRSQSLYAISLSALGSLANTLDMGLLEPNVQRHVGVIPSSVCNHIIDMGEKAGFLVQKESIDGIEQNDTNKR